MLGRRAIEAEETRRTNLPSQQLRLFRTCRQRAAINAAGSRGRQLRESGTQ